MRGSVATMVQRRAPRSCGSLVSVASLLTASSILTSACHGVVAGPHAATTPPGPARVTINPAAGAIDRRPDLGITVNATDGTLTSVTAEDGHGKNVAGHFNPAGTAWHSTWALAPARSYAVTAVAAGLDGGASTAHATFRTSAPAQTFTASVDMLPGETVGVGMPIMVTFSQPIQNKAQVERSFQLRSSKPVVGAWHWLDDTTTWFRPKRHWPAHDAVRFTAHLAGVRGGEELYGGADLARSFKIGESLVAVASARSHRMKVWLNGRLRFNWPISTGQPGHDTPDGAYVTIEKGNPVDMNSCSFGVCKGDPGYYNVEVYDSVRFTWSGDYIHSAPWSVGEQGYANVSHGCVNLAPAYAAWYYDHAERGDPVTVIGSPVRGTWGDGWTIWFLSWRALVKGSALDQAVVAGRDGSYFTDQASAVRLASASSGR